MKPHRYAMTVIGGTAGSGKTKCLIERLIDMLETYEERKALLVVREESAMAIAARITDMGHQLNPALKRLEVVEYAPFSKNPAAWQEGPKLLIERFIYERNFDVVAFDDNPTLCQKLIEFDAMNEISREYFNTVQHQRIPSSPKLDYGEERLHIPDYSLGA